jgi:predicted DNA-binding protein with PD1-like motif
MTLFPLRLQPGADLRAALDEHLKALGVTAAFVVAGIGSLTVARLRLAADASETKLEGPLELLSLSGTLSIDGSHLHMAVSDADGKVRGGHVCPGCEIRTTAEVLIAELPDWEFRREADEITGYRELAIRPRRRSQT